MLSLRLVVSDESFWIDELHSVWTIDGSLSEVSSRAIQGNQTPWYFYLLCVWQRLFGESELSLRLPSVIASVATCLLLLSSRGRTPSFPPIANLLAAAFFALESNSIFFSTEVRPYALIMLLSTIMTFAFLRSRSVHAIQFDLVLFLSTLLLSVLHLTSGLLCMGLLFASLGCGSRRSTGAVAAGFVFGTTVNLPSLFIVWKRRNQWTNIGVADLQHLIDLFPWIPLMLLPLVFLLVLRLFSVGNSKAGMFTLEQRLLVFLITFVVGFAYFFSITGIAAIFHRRYLVSVLPLICWVAGNWWSVVAEQIEYYQQSCFGKWTNFRAVTFIRLPTVALAICTLLYSQGTFTLLASGSLRLVHRGENWRDATRFIRAHRQPNEPAFIAAELLESRLLLNDVTTGTGKHAIGEPVDALIDYLCFPTSSVYYLPQTIPLGPLGNQKTLTNWQDLMQTQYSNVQACWLIVRAPAGPIQEWLALDAVHPLLPSLIKSIEVDTFGGVTVLRFADIYRLQSDVKNQFD